MRKQLTEVAEKISRSRPSSLDVQYDDRSAISNFGPYMKIFIRHGVPDSTEGSTPSGNNEPSWASTASKPITTSRDNYSPHTMD
ncbi:hypothetical protein OUZ56_004128 [Daphnia magna]|uniref:Uncharacterized protein n=1 Tax=Daphnia magna TaxID=35525 RepID=A0ABQ9YP13_9CRUS|nr:hypothetical protein OUZ56_004128 [Daphnia magna]